MLCTVISICTYGQSRKNFTKKQIRYCEISGIVRFHFNDYQGFKPDLGANVFLVKTKYTNMKVKQFEDEHEEAYSKIFPYMMAKQNQTYKDIFDSDLRRICSYDENDKKLYESCSDSLFHIYYKLKEKSLAETFVDASGIYKFEKIPYGNYYIIFFSKNRKRLSIYESDGRKMIIPIYINKKNFIQSFDFEY